MITAGSILTDVMRAINETDRNTYGPINLGAISRAYKKDVLHEHWWPESMRLFQPTDAVAASTAQPIVLPGDFVRMRTIRDSSYTYYQDFTRGVKPIHPYNWFFDEPVKTALQSGTGATVSKDGTTVDVSASGLTLSTSAAGEYIHIGQSDDAYLISTRDSASALTINRAFRTDKDIRNAAWQIRPPGLKRIKLVYVDSTACSPTTLTCEYQCSPVSIVSEDDILELSDAAANAVLVKATMYAMQRKGWNRAAQNLEPEYRRALAIAKRECPMPPDDVTPKRMFRRPTNDDILRTIREN